jgi:hypothetical protein
MLQFLLGRTSDRKLRLFSLLCCRRIEPWLKDQRSLRAIDVSEQYAEGLVGRKALNAARRDAFAAMKDAERLPVIGDDQRAVEHATVAALNACSGKFREGTEENNLVFTAGCVASLLTSLAGNDWRRAYKSELSYQLTLLRDIFGNPFRPVAFDPRWRTADVLGLARAIYEDRAFDRLPLLADALMDAGCGHDDILGHCRGGGPHVRGCWAVDLVLGKE